MSARSNSSNAAFPVWLSTAFETIERISSNSRSSRYRSARARHTAASRARGACSPLVSLELRNTDRPAVDALQAAIRQLCPVRATKPSIDGRSKTVWCGSTKASKPGIRSSGETTILKRTYKANVAGLFRMLAFGIMRSTSDSIGRRLVRAASFSLFMTLTCWDSSPSQSFTST